jgi:hypothetical protein
MLISAIVFLAGGHVVWFNRWTAREEKHRQEMAQLAADKDVIIGSLANQKDEALGQIGAEKDRFIAFLERLSNMEED